MTKCRRCGDHFELRRAGDEYCLRCLHEVDQLMAADAARKVIRFDRAKDFSGQTEGPL